MGPLEDRFCPNRESFKASVTAVVSALPRFDPLGLLAMRTDGPFRPAVRFDILTGGFFIWEHLGKCKNADCGTAHSVQLPFL